MFVSPLNKSMSNQVEWDIPAMLAAFALILGAAVLIIRGNSRVRSSSSKECGGRKRDLTSSVLLAGTAIAVLTVVVICHAKQCSILRHPEALVLTPLAEA